MSNLGVYVSPSILSFPPCTFQALGGWQSHVKQLFCGFVSVCVGVWAPYVYVPRVLCVDVHVCVDLGCACLNVYVPRVLV